MNLLLVLIALAIVGAIGATLVLGLICFVVGVQRGDRADLGLAPSGWCSRLARRTAGVYVTPPYVSDNNNEFIGVRRE